MGGDDAERIWETLNLHPLIVLAMLSLMFGLALAFLVAGLSKSQPRSFPMGRKIFHIAVFSGAVPAQIALGFWGVVTYGSILSIVILGVSWRGRDPVLVESLTAPDQEDGAPPRTIPIPFLSTVLGGLLGTLLVGQFAIVGYLVCGWGDATGEIVGKRWGRRPYATPFRRNGAEARTIEGSLGVFIAGAFGAAVALILLGFPPLTALSVGLLCGGSGAIAEAFSGQKTDNLWVQVIPALTAWWVLV